MITVNAGPCTVDVHNNAGILVSGGADSAILLYILLKYSTEPVTVYTLASKIKQRSSLYYSSKVIDKCLELTKKEFIYQKIIYVQQQNLKNLFLNPDNDWREKKISIIYNAETQIPPYEVVELFQSKLDREIINLRNPNIVHKLYLNNMHYRPFKNINKKQIFEIYNFFNVIDELFPLTRSCEDLTLFDKHCGHCWWCEERLWGFNNL